MDSTPTCSSLIVACRIGRSTTHAKCVASAQSVISAWKMRCPKKKTPQAFGAVRLDENGAPFVEIVNVVERPDKR